MTATITLFEENAGSRKGDVNRSTRTYTVAGTSDTGVPLTEDDLNAYLLTLVGTVFPTQIAGYKISDAAYQENEEIPGQFEVTITWDVSPEVFYRFNFQAAGGHFVQSLRTVSAWGIGGRSATMTPLDLKGAGFPNFNGAIGVTPQQDGPPIIEGVDVQPPPETFTLRWNTDSSVVTTDYQLKLYNMCGRVNDHVFRNLPIGSTMLVRANGEEKLGPTGRIWSLEFGFGYIPNVVNFDYANQIVIGDGNMQSIAQKIVIREKAGLDLVWLYREHGSGLDTGSSDLASRTDYAIVAPQAKVAYVEQVWPRADFNTLTIPG
jgi:hypothetical protein